MPTLIELFEEIFSVVEALVGIAVDRAHVSEVVRLAICRGE